MKQIIPALLVLVLMAHLPAAGQADYDIRFEVANYDNDSLLIGYNFGTQQYIRDTLLAESKGHFRLRGTDTLKSGMYLAVLLPSKSFIEFLVDGADTHFKVQFDAKDPGNSVKISGSPTNKIFKEYADFLSGRRKEADELQQEIKLQDSLKNEKKLTALKARLDELDKEVRAYQRRFVEKHKGTLPAAIIKALTMVDIPDFKGSEEEIRKKQYYYYRRHYFDNIDLTDERLLYTNVLASKINTYIDKVLPQHPDTISAELDMLLKRMEPNPEVFKFFLIDFLNKFAKSQIVGFDAIYVHLVKNYYEKGKAPWVEEEQLAKIVRDANLLDPVLIGKKAPNLTLYKKDGTPHQLYDVDKDYTLLFFWSPECGHCKKAAPYLVDFFKKYKDKVAVITICNEILDKSKKCWEFIDDHQFNDMINLADPRYRSNFKVRYNVKTTPTIYILDKDKKIIMKRIPAKELPRVMDELMKRNAENN